VQDLEEDATMYNLNYKVEPSKKVSQRQIHRARLAYWPPPNGHHHQWRWTECQNVYGTRPLGNPREQKKIKQKEVVAYVY